MRRIETFQTPLGLMAGLVLMCACTKTDPEPAPTTSLPPKMEALVTAEWLLKHIDDPDLIVLDTTVVVEVDESGTLQSLSGRENYVAGHIPTAAFADLTTNLSGNDSSLQFTMPDVDEFSAAIGALGVGNDSRVIVYSATYPDWAARVWWMLRWAGHDDVAILDGGRQAWVAAGGELSSEPTNRAARPFVADVRARMIANRGEVLSAIDNSGITVIDALSVAHYEGQFSLYARPGHIRSAVNMPSSDLLDEEGNYRSFDELDMMHDSSRDARTITYCGGGIAASSAAFTMHRLGYKDVAVYMGSLQEWVADPENPMVLGAP